MFFINHWYIYNIFAEINCSLQVIGESLEAVEATARGKEKAWINRHKLGLQNFLPVPIPISTYVIVCKYILVSC